MKTCENIKPLEKTKVYDFLYKQTPVHSTWIIAYRGYREATFYIDSEDLWSSWFPEQHGDKYVKSYSYDEKTNKGYIEYE
jgi:hypothetical protein